MIPLSIRGQAVNEGIAPAICIPLVGRSAEAVRAELAVVLEKKPDLIEWRVDFFGEITDTAAVVALARSLRQAAAATPIIFTCRSVKEGGEPHGRDETAIVELLEAVCASGCVDFIDYELCNLWENVARLRDASRAQGVQLIMSYHNFQCTPDAEFLGAKFAEAERLGADVAKVAVMPKSPADVLTLLSATQRASETVAIPLISMAMGGVGAVSRIVGGVFGSAVTFAVGKSASAPGQIAIEELRTALTVVRQASVSK